MLRQNIVPRWAIFDIKINTAHVISLKLLLNPMPTNNGKLCRINNARHFAFSCGNIVFNY